MTDFYKYYGSFREEIKREDEITHNRMITSMTFQGLLMAAMGFMISGAWPVAPDATKAADSIYDAVVHFRIGVIGFIGVVGFLVSVSSAMGILATRLSIGDVKDTYDALTRPKDGPAILPIDNKVPQIHGRGICFKMGNFYTISIPIIFMFLWVSYVTGFAILICDVSIAVGFGAGLFIFFGVASLLWALTCRGKAQRVSARQIKSLAVFEIESAAAPGNPI